MNPVRCVLSTLFVCAAPFVTAGQVSSSQEKAIAEKDTFGGIPGQEAAIPESTPDATNPQGGKDIIPNAGTQGGSKGGKDIIPEAGSKQSDKSNTPSTPTDSDS